MRMVVYIKRLINSNHRSNLFKIILYAAADDMGIMVKLPVIIDMV